MSRFLAALAMVCAMLASSAAAISAQETPVESTSALSDLGYPEVTITATESGFEIPTDVPAGPVQLTLMNNAPFPNGFSMVQLPEGVALEDLLPPPSEGAPSPDAAPAPEDLFPPVLYDATWAGGGFAMPGSASSTVVYLTAGEWVVVPPPGAPIPPAVMTVSGEATGSIETVEGAVAVELDNFQIRLPEHLQAGQQVWHLSNVGEQPHEVSISRTPERLTVEEAQALMLMPPGAEPDPNLPNPEEFEMVAFLAPVSQAQSSLTELNLEPGHYVAVCFVPDQESGQAHAARGMVTIFSIGAEGEVVEPPASPVAEDAASH